MNVGTENEAIANIKALLDVNEKWIIVAKELRAQRDELAEALRVTRAELFDWRFQYSGAGCMRIADIIKQADAALAALAGVRS